MISQDIKQYNYFIDKTDMNLHHPSEYCMQYYHADAIPQLKWHAFTPLVHWSLNMT